MKLIVFLGRSDEEYKKIAQIAPTDVAIIFMEEKEENMTSFEETRKSAKFWAQKLEIPVLAKSSNVNKQKKIVSFLSFFKPDSTEIGAVATTDDSIRKACIKCFNHM